MKNIEINNAYEITEKIAECNTLSNSVLWNIFQLRKFLKPHIDFYTERLKTIQDKYVEFADDKGQIYGETMQKYISEVDELNNMDKDISDIPQYHICLSDVPGITIHEMECLDKFIVFSEN